VSGRYGTTPRRGGSRLKLELANDGIVHAGFSESPQHLDHPLSANRVFTPSRMMPVNEPSEMGEMSPHHSRAPTAYDSAPLPMPPRRTRCAPSFHVPKPTSSPAAVASAKKDAKPKPFVLETPAAAPRYSKMGRPEPCKYADFFPWTGEGPEDKFSEKAIRNGYFDNNGPSAQQQQQSELASAKGPLSPALKHKGGLQTLSTVFTGILNQRRHSGQISSTSTFKPPPRVTLTDTKREVWLKDLANPQISLRRLSRTIPHGIRGKVLLDQCLNKNVPTDRAVWLAKCVGANEIRAFKRKGVNNTFVMGGEAKWIRDWTVFVEQFVDSVANAFAEEDWKAKVTYA
jgi:mediator of RNA polymerase II transcription subunit 12, fungi type